MAEPRPAVLPLTGDAILHSDNKSTTLVVSQNNLFLKSVRKFTYCSKKFLEHLF